MDLSSTKRILNEYCLTPNRALGQNFLVDEAAANAIASSAACGDVLEIGAGLGALSEALLNRKKRVTAVEIDPRMAHVLQSRFAGAEFTLICADFLKVDVAGLFRGEFSVAANLPYYITTPVCIKLIASPLPIRSLTLMVQREAAERFFAQPGDRVYGPLTVLARCMYSISRLLTLSPDSFYPQPGVDSAVVQLDRLSCAFEPKLPRMLDAAFSMRRKTLANNLKRLGVAPDAIAALGIDPGIRAEALTHEEFLRLCTLI